MDKSLKWVAGIAITLMILMFYWFHLLMEDYREISDLMRQQVGKEVIIQKDTLLVTDYSVMNESFKLSDGRNVSVQFLAKYADTTETDIDN